MKTTYVKRQRGYQLGVSIPRGTRKEWKQTGTNARQTQTIYTEGFVTRWTKNLVQRRYLLTVECQGGINCAHGGLGPHLRVVQTFYVGTNYKTRISYILHVATGVIKKGRQIRLTCCNISETPNHGTKRHDKEKKKRGVRVIIEKTVLTQWRPPPLAIGFILNKRYETYWNRRCL